MELADMGGRVSGSANVWWGGEIPPLERLNQLNDSGMPSHVGIEFTDVGPDWMTARMPVDHRTQQPFKRLHGGASVVLAETVGSVAAGNCVERGKFVAVGMEINANHIRPAYDGFVYGTARPENIGRTTHVWSIRIEDEKGRLVCISRLTMAVIPIDRK